MGFIEKISWHKVNKQIQLINSKWILFKILLLHHQGSNSYQLAQISKTFVLPIPLSIKFMLELNAHGTILLKMTCFFN